MVHNGCSRHMTGDKSKFAKLELKKEGFVTYGGNNKGRITYSTSTTCFQLKG